MKEIQKLHEWFLENQRSFPWRVLRTPYRVLVSEMMLQQTRASVVVPYFERWMEHFPSVQALANAPQTQVIKLWEGLGYYARARHLHAAAKQVVEQFGGEIPSTKEELATITGLGPYTVGALLSFGFQQRAAAVDGNVARVLSRYFLIEEPIQKAAVRRRLNELAEMALDKETPWVTAEAWIELGASLCTKKPQCSLCPLQGGCLGFQTGKAPYLPLAPTPPETIHLFRSVFLCEAEGALLVRSETKERLMADLYELPYVEKRDCPLAAYRLPFTVKHSFTRFIAHLTPYSIQFFQKAEVFPFLESCGITSLHSYSWVDVKRLQELPFSAGHRKIVHYWITHADLTCRSLFGLGRSRDADPSRGGRDEEPGASHRLCCHEARKID